MSWDNDDVFLGGNTEIGEAIRGLQSSFPGYDHMGAAAPQRGALTQLRGALGQVAANRFNSHAPLQRTLRSPYKDSTQIGIECSGTFAPSAWTGSTVLPQISGLTRVYQSFKPTKAIVTEILIVTFETASLGAVTRAARVQDAGDVLLVQAFAGSYNCFPNAPNQGNGIAGPTFANNSLGNGISWPTINGGIDMSVAFAVESTVLYEVTPPSGYTQDDITSVQVKVRFNLLGPSLR